MTVSIEDGNLNATMKTSKRFMNNYTCLTGLRLFEKTQITVCLVNSDSYTYYCLNNNNNNNKYIVCLPQAVCGCGWLIINASVEAYRACQVYESSLSSQQSQSDSHSALNIKC